MIFSKRFLHDALGEVTVQVADTVLHEDSAQWQMLESLGEVSVCIDSRNVKKGDFFIPLQGTRVDGHDFIENVLRSGACGSLVAREHIKLIKKLPVDVKNKKLFIIVPNVLDAFVSLAKTWRLQLSCPVVGITGSVGKTSTKEMIRSILDVAGIESYVSYKNYNTLIGVCYNLLCAPLTAHVVVQEVGIDSKGEMREIADVLRPTIGVITCVSHAHSQGLGQSLQEISNEKRQLFSFFTPQDVGIICGDQPLLSDMYYAHPIAKFGLKIKNQVQARKIKFEESDDGTFVTKFVLKWYEHRRVVTLQTNHSGMTSNALAASTIAYFLKISLQDVVSGIEKYQGFESRFEQKQIKGDRGRLFSDCYNANPESMKAALLAFSHMKTKGPKIAVLGDMLELGQRELYWHRQLGRMLSKVSDLDCLILVGKLAKLVAKTAPLGLEIEHVDTWQQAQKKLEAKLKKESLVLVKASRAVALDNVVQAVTESLSA